MEVLEFHELTGKEEIAKALLLYPDDWQEALLPVWPLYADTAKVFALINDGIITCLGILFQDDAPEMDAFPEIAIRLFQKGIPYIGFLYTLPEHRGKGHASLWLAHLKTVYPKDYFWLTVEDSTLIRFYERNGFYLYRKSKTRNEWLLTSRENPVF